MRRAAGGVRESLAATLQDIWASRGASSSALLPLSWAFAATAYVRRTLFRHGLPKVARVPVPVVVVGNIIAGGAGKTPAVLAIVKILRAHGYTPGIVSRGYGRRAGRSVVVVEPDAKAGDVGDEPLLLRRKSNAPVAVGADRAEAARELLRAHPQVDIIVSDDGLQHHALERDVEVLVFDERGAGNGRMLPAGPLREPLPTQLGAKCIVLYNAGEATTRLPGFASRRALAGIVPLPAWWRGSSPTLANLDLIRNRRVVAVAGLARPARFFAMLRDCGIDIEERSLPDHHDFATLPWPPATDDVVLTEKDAIKIAPSRPSGTRVWVAALDFEPEAAFAAALMARLPRPASMFETATPAT